MTIREIQAALAERGYRPGPLDGIYGRQTIAAVRAFQAANGLEVDGLIGPLTLDRLFGAEPPVDVALDDPQLVWFQEARRLIGTRETPGRGSNPDILDWADGLGLDYAGDDIPWCGLFTGHCIAATLDREPLPAVLLRARAWERFGIATAPTAGAIMVFWRDSLTSGKGHVGFYAGEDKTAYRILGGNQSNSVSLAWITKDRLVASRWPATVPALRPRIVKATRQESLSWQEA